MIERYALPEMKSLWEEEEKIKLWHYIEQLNLEALSKKGLLDESSVEEFSRIELPTQSEIEKEESSTNHDVVAFLNLLLKKTDKIEIRRFLHFGMTSSDLLDTALSYRVRKSVQILLREMAMLFTTLKSTALKHKATKQIGRTHGMHAEPTVFGIKMMNFAFSLHRSHTYLSNLLEDLSVVKFSGTVGSYRNTSPDIEVYIAEKLKARYSPVSTQVIMRDQFSHILNTIAVSTTVCEAIATEIRGLQRSEIGEVEEYFGINQKGSSAMPHKKNPILSERICGLSRTIRGYLVPAMENIVLWHERDISHSSSERIVFPDFMTISQYILVSTERLIKNLVVKTDKMLDNFNIGSNKFYSASILTELVKCGFERKKAYDILQSISNSIGDKGDLILEIEKKLGVKLNVAVDNSTDRKNLQILFGRLDELSLD